MRHGWSSGMGPGLMVLIVGLLGLLAPWALVAVALVLAVWAVRQAPGSVVATPPRERDRLER